MIDVRARVPRHLTDRSGLDALCVRPERARDVVAGCGLVVSSGPVGGAGVENGLGGGPREAEWAVGDGLAGIPRFVVRLCEVRRKVVVERKVQAVQPDHGLVSVVAVVVPLPLRREDEVAFFHADFLAADGGEAAGPFDDEAEGEGLVAMRRGRLAWQDQLETCIDSICSER